MTSPALTLYHAPPSRSSIALWMLEEVNQPYDLKLLSLKLGDNLKPDYLAVNPSGKVPALVDNEVVITEVAAICCHLADRYPQAGLAPAVGDSRRGPYLTWLFWGPSCFEPAIVDHAMKRPSAPRAMQGWVDYKTTLDIIEAALLKGPYIGGDRFTAADVVIGAGINWGLIFGTVEKRPAFEAYSARLKSRPALQRATAKDTELAKQLG
jgi:glutathione S-transferase